MAFLIDADILIYSIKGHERAHEHFLRNKTAPQFVSVVSYGELLLGTTKRNN